MEILQPVVVQGKRIGVCEDTICRTCKKAKAKAEYYDKTDKNGNPYEEVVEFDRCDPCIKEALVRMDEELNAVPEHYRKRTILEVVVEPTKIEPIPETKEERIARLKAELEQLEGE